MDLRMAAFNLENLFERPSTSTTPLARETTRTRVPDRSIRTAKSGVQSQAAASPSLPSSGAAAGNASSAGCRANERSSGALPGAT